MFSDIKNESQNIPDECETRSLRTCTTAPKYRESVSEPFSPAVSEYAPSLNRSRSSSPVRSFDMTISSSLVRDVNLALTEDCTTPPTRSENRFQFSTPCNDLCSIDFIASPTVIYKTNNDVLTNNNVSELSEYVDGVNTIFTRDINCTSLTDISSDNLIHHSLQLLNAPNSLPSNIISIRDKTVSMSDQTETYLITPIEPISINNDLDLTDNFHNDEHRVYLNLVAANQNDNLQDLSLPSTSFVSENACSHNDNANTNIIITANCHTNGEQSVIGDIAGSSRALLTSESNIKCRKRARNTEEWSKCKQKSLKNKGLEYHSINTKKLRQCREIGSPCECKMKCFDTFTQANRSEIFQYYWNIGNHEKQWLYILNYIEVEEPKVIKVQRKRDRSRTLIYYLPFNKDANVTKLRVCKVMFLNTLGIKEKTVYSAMSKYTNNQQITDLRGKHANRPHKTSNETEQSVIQHIKSFPCIESHYLRKKTSRQYLASDLNLAKMHRLYALWMSENLNSVKVASLYQYSNIFNSQFNLSFFKPKKDMCQICSIYDNADPGRKIELKDNYESHLKNKFLIRKIKDDEKSSSNLETKTVAVFDLEKVLNLPQSNVGIFHYKRKYPVYNFTVYNLLSSQGYCFVWHAQIAKRGANEISSCLFDFFKKEAQKGIKSVSLYSDNCSGQNRNRFIFAMYMHASRTLNMEIVHRFLQTGHTQNEGDCMHACVEKNLKNKVVYTPDQLYEIITNAKVHKKFVMTEMSQNLFYDFKSLVASNNNWLKDTRGEKVYFSKLKEVKVTPEAPTKLFFKYDFEQNEYFELDTKSYSSSRTRKTQPVPSELKTAYKDLLPVSTALYQDLKSLCDSNAIPLHYQGFYRSLVTDDTRNLLPSDNSDDD